MAGWQAIEQGDPRSAESIARNLLRGNARPRDPLGVFAHNLLAVSLMQQSRHEEALRALSVVLERDPGSAGTHLNMGGALTQLGRHEEAIAHFSKAAEIEPRLSQAHSNLGTVLAGLGRLDEAAAAYRKAVSAEPRDLQAWNSLGVALDRLERHEEAIECFLRTLALDPGNADAHTNLGVAYQRAKRLDEAVASHRKAISIAPRLAGAHLNLGLALREQGLIDAAAESFRTALALEADYPEAHAQLGIVHRMQGRLQAAIASLRTAISRKPDDVEALVHLGAAFHENGQSDLAVTANEKAIALDPRSANARHNLGIALQGLGRHDEAIAAFGEALEIDPEHKYTQGALLWSRLLSCRWDALESQALELRTAVRQGKSLVEPFTMVSVAEHPEEQRLCAARFYEDRVKSRARLWDGDRYAHEKLRVAYLSADFREHAVANCIAEVIELHDRSRFEVIGASFGMDDGSALRARLLRGFDRVFDLRPAGDLEAARLLREAEVDIAVDLMGYTLFARPGIFAQRPCPIQVGYLGYPGTVGAEFLDYILADRYVIPEEHEQYYSEKIAYLPGSYQANDSRREISQQSVTRAQAGLPEKGFVYCCFNNSYKVRPQFFDIWMRLLKQVPGSVLWMLGEGAARDSLRREAQARGVDAERLVFAQRVSVGEYRARCRLADLVLDTLPYNGHGTSGDMLWSGVPILTCAGKTFAGRVAGSLLRAVGLPELATGTLEEYEALGLELARDPGRLSELRKRLERNREKAPLFDSERFCRHLESAFRTMWETWQRGEPPKTFDVEPVR
jgi:predicted O-linked N-acetylglucosamine transferase (SPINDLY family)